MCVFLLTDISRALGNGQVGASTPRTPLVVPLTAPAVRPSGIVLTLAAQLLFVKHAAVGVKVAFAPVKEEEEVFRIGMKEDNYIDEGKKFCISQ